jgi:hypothetical protein
VRFALPSMHGASSALPSSAHLRDARIRGVAMTTGWQPTTLVQCISTRAWLEFPGCDAPGGCHDLTLGKIYEMLGVEGNGSFFRILDDSGEDFLYPASHFKTV